MSARAASVVGVVGGYGEIGAHVVRALHRAGVGHLRVGGRDIGRARALVEDHLGGVGTALRVDAGDPHGLWGLADGCQVLVNAAGPSCSVGEPVAQAARDVGVHLVDVGGDDPLYDVLAGRPSGLTAAGQERVELLSAGMQPGLTAVLPRYLATAFTRVEAATVWFAVLDRFTPAAAEDYLEGTAQRLSEPLAAWRDGRRASRALRRTDETVVVPGMSGRFTSLPVMTTEGERLATTLRLSSGEWYTLMAEGRVSSLLDRLHTMSRSEANQALCVASQVDMAGRTPAATLLAEVRGAGSRAGETSLRSGMLRGPGTGALAGAAAASAVIAVLEGEVPPGLHYAAQALDPVRALERVSVVPGIELRAVDGPVTQVDPHEEGEL